MRQITITTEIIPKDQILNKLEEHGICINRYAKEFFFTHDSVPKDQED